jgi:tetratricopeptide (TPR) repeat protein
VKSLTLHLKQAAGPVRAQSAWFIAGADPAIWLEEICRIEIPHEKLRLFLVPRSGTDRSVAGALVMSLSEGIAGSHSTLEAERRSPALLVDKARVHAELDLCTSYIVGSRLSRAIPYGVVAGKLYLPVDAELWPPIEASELKLLHELQVFHPGIGLIGFDAADGLKLADLLRPPPSRVENWNFARPGTGFNTRLRAVTISVPVSPPDIFGDASKEIGSEPIIDLPATPDEPGDGAVSKLWRDANEKFARFVSSIVQRPGRPGKGRSWVNQLAEWAQARLTRLTAELQTLRHKELNRLLHQLENDPEVGLRHAIPLNRTHHRGLAPPGGRLTRKNPDFNLGHLSGGTPADFWDIPGEMRQQLVLRYRELANRELQLGRFRRAAYIFAELLGDLESAASALKQGRHFREAAVVYQEHLRRPREAALCLAEGGLFQDAIAIYEKESLFFEAADLYLRIGEMEKAAAAYRLEIEKLLRREDRLGAAKVLEEHLESPDEALSVLADGWPNSSQALPCLEAQFSFLARHGRHAQGIALVEQLRAERTRPGLVPPLAGLLSRQSAQYPDQRVRKAAADVTRAKAGERLELAPPAEAVQLADAIVKLAPEDRLLARDAVRFVAKRNESFRRRVVVPPPPQKGHAPVLVRNFQLPAGFRWHTIKSCATCFFAAGFGRDNLVLLRGDWDGKVQAVNWPSPDLSESRLLLEFDEATARPLSLILAGFATPILARVPVRSLSETRLFEWGIQAGTWDWIPDDVLAVSNRDSMSFLLRQTTNGIVLECHRLDGTLIGNTGFDRVSGTIGGPFRRASLLIQRELAWVAAGRTLLLNRPGKPMQSWTVESEVLSLVGSAPHLSLCALARLEQGVAIQWYDAIQEYVDTICGELERPLAAFTKDGTLILLSGREGRICDVRRNKTRVHSFEWSCGDPLAVVRAGAANEFIVFTKSGEGQLFRIQSDQ